MTWSVGIQHFPVQPGKVVEYTLWTVPRTGFSAANSHVRAFFFTVSKAVLVFSTFSPLSTIACLIIGQRFFSSLKYTSLEMGEEKQSVAKEIITTLP